MTTNRNFKRLVRERMAKTGERYSTARSHVLVAGPTGGPGLGWTPFAGVSSVGGHQPDLAAARNLCTNAGVLGPDGSPLSEAMAFGLAGGIGFLYGVFAYDDGPTMTIVCRNESMPDPFIEPLFARVGAKIGISTTTGEKKAAATLDRAVEERQPVLCTVGAGALGYLGEAPSMAAIAPHLVGVVGATDDGQVMLDDRSPEPILVDRAEFDRARAAYKKAKHRLIAIQSIDAEHDWAEAVTEAIRDGVAGYDTPPVPQFASNVGVAGLRKWRDLLSDTRDPKGWPQVFSEGRAAAIGLSRLHDCIDHAYTAPSAGRPLYGEFLAEAAAALEGSAAFDGARVRSLTEAADRFRRSGDVWAEIVSTTIGSDAGLAAYADLAAERASGLDVDAGAVIDRERMQAIGREQDALVAGSTIEAGRAAETYRRIAELVDQIITEEARALDLLR